MKSNWILCLLSTLIILQFTLLPGFADDFWDLPSKQTEAPKAATGHTTGTDDDFWSGGGNTSLDSYMKEREELRLAEEARIKAAEEARRQARLEQQRQREAEAKVAAVEKARREAELYAKRRQEQQHNTDHSLFGKIAAIGMGAVIANSSSLNSAAKTDFLTNYSTDVLNNDMSMSHTNQWKNNMGRKQGGANSGGGSSEEQRNREISSRCKQDSMTYNDGDGQSTPHCQLAIYNKCVADKLCSLYPDKCTALRARVTSSCDTLGSMGDTLCPVCRKK